MRGRWARWSAIVGATVSAAHPTSVAAVGLGSSFATTPNNATLIVLSQPFEVDPAQTQQIRLALDGVELPAAAFAVPTTTVPASTSTSAPDGSDDPVDTSDPRLDYQVSIRVYPPIESVSSIEEPPTGTALATNSFVLADVGTEADAGVEIELDVDAITPSPFSDNEGEVFPVEIELDAPDGLLARVTTFLASPSDAAGPTLLGLARVTDIGPLPSDADVDSARVELERLVDLLNSTEQPMTVLIPPSVISAVLDDDPPLAGRLNSALSGHDVLAAPAYELHPDSAIEADLSVDFANDWSRGEALLNETFPSATFVADTTILDDPTSPDGLALLSKAGIESLVVPIDTLLRAKPEPPTEQGDANYVTRTAAGDLSVTASSDAALGLLQAPLEADETPDSRAVKVLAAISLRGSTGTEPVLVATPDIGVPDPTIFSALQTMAPDSMTWTAVSDLGPRPTEGSPLVWDPEGAIPLRDRVDKLRAAGLVIGDGISMLPADDDRRNRWPNRLREAQSTALTDSQADWMMGYLRKRVDGLRGSVRAPDAFDFTFTSADATLRFQLPNESNTELTVVAVIISDRLVVPERTVVTLAPNAVNDVAIDVTARSNGTARLWISLETPAGNQLVAPAQMTGRVTSFGGLGNLASAGAVLVLMSWWFAYIRRQRSLAKQSASEGDGAESEDPTVVSDEPNTDPTAAGE